MKIPKEKNIHPKIISEKKLKIFTELTKYVGESAKNGHVIESFIIAYQITQEIMLPELMQKVLAKLSLEKLISKVSAEKSPYNLNLQYVYLTHDIELFHFLEDARKIRNEIIHKLTTDETLEKTKGKAKKGLKLIALKIFSEIRDRMNGKKAIPVLTLYPRGWNDYREVAIKTINEICS